MTLDRPWCREPGGPKNWRRIWSFAVAIMIGIPLAVESAAGHGTPPSIQADHAFLADPLFTLETGNGLFAVAADARQGMASTTKVMTLLVALDAIRVSRVSMTDQVTVSANAAAQGPPSQPRASSMTDDLGSPLQQGEVVRFRHLIHGMMIPSGNNAAFAIAEHVAQETPGSSNDIAEFAGLMNAKAAELGLEDTTFTNPSGDADPKNTTGAFNHFTTARELVQMWNEGMRDATFRELVRPQTFTATGDPPSGPNKTYTLTRMGNYPGSDGYKNGVNIHCDDLADGNPGTLRAGDDECFVMSATRIGRRLIAAQLQGNRNGGAGTGDAITLLDYGFRTLFHPDPRGSSTPIADASTHALACPTPARAVSAVVPKSGALKLVSWDRSATSGDLFPEGSVTAPADSLRKGATLVNALASVSVDLIMRSKTAAITVLRVGDKAEFGFWSVPTNGDPVWKGGYGRSLIGAATSIELAHLESAMYATAQIVPAGNMVLRTWRPTTFGPVLMKSLTVASPATVTELDLTTDVFHAGRRLVTVARTGTGFLIAQTWDVNRTSGAMTQVGSRTLAIAGTSVSIAPIPRKVAADELLATTEFAIGARSGANTRILYIRVAPDGTITSADPGGVPTQLMQPTEDFELVGFGDSGALAASRTAGGKLRLSVWEGPGRSTIADADAISDHDGVVGTRQIRVCSMPTSNATGDFVTAGLEQSPAIVRLRGWRVAKRP